MNESDPSYELWKYFADYHGITLVDTELTDIIAAVKKYLKEIEDD